MKTHITYLLIISALLLWLLNVQSDSQFLESVEVMHNDTVYLDTTTQVINKPDSIVHRFKIVNQTDTFWQHVDSAAIIKDYLSAVHGTHIVKNDTMGFLSFNYTLERNRLKGINNIKFQNRQPIKIIHKHTKRKNTFLIGGGIMAHTKADFYAKIGYQNNKWQYSAGYSIISKRAFIGVDYIF